MASNPKTDFFFDTGKHYRSLDEILTPTKTEISIATNRYIHKYDSLVEEFKHKTSLTDLDISIMVVAAALQVFRWYLVDNNFGKFANATDADKAFEKIANSEYCPSAISSLLSDHTVPYDALQRSARFKTIYPGESIGLSGANHRYKTLGHDPMAGFIIGTANIATNTLSVNDMTALYPCYHIKNQQIDGKTDMYHVLKWTTNMLQEKPDVVGMSFLKQVVHMGTDFFTTQSLPLPGINVLSPEASQFLMGHGVHIDLYTVTRAAALAAFINKVVEMFHKLFFNKNTDNERLYEARTLKILMYSNTLSSVLNVGYVATTKDFTKLDIGGIAVTLWQLLNNRKKLREIRAEFIDRTLSNEYQKEEDEVNEMLASYGYNI